MGLLSAFENIPALACNFLTPHSMLLQPIYATREIATEQRFIMSVPPKGTPPPVLLTRKN